MLAAAAGSAQYANQQTQQDYNRYLNQLAIDSAFVSGEMDRRVQSHNLNTQLMAQQVAREQQNEAFAMQDAYSTAKARLVGSPTNPAIRPQAPQPAPSVSGVGVPAQLPTQMSQNAGGGYMIQSQAPAGQTRINTQLGPDGRIVSSAPQGGGFVRGTPPAPPVDSNVQSQLNYLEAIRDQIPVDQYNAMLVAARSGQLNLGQFIDDARQAAQPDSSRMTLAQRSAERRQQDVLELQAVLDAGDPFVAKTYAQTKYGLDPLITSPEAAESFLRNQLTGLAAIDANAGSASRMAAGGGIVNVSSPEEAAQLPSGTMFRTPDGRVIRKN